MVSLPFDKRSNHSLRSKVKPIMNEIKKIEDFLSNSRFRPYLDYCGEHEGKALNLYQMNLRLNGAFFPILSMLEVALRNSIDKKMTTSYPLSGEENWIARLKRDIQSGIDNRRLFNTMVRKELSCNLA